MAGPRPEALFMSIQLSWYGEPMVDDEVLGNEGQDADELVDALRSEDWAVAMEGEAEGWCA